MVTSNKFINYTIVVLGISSLLIAAVYYSLPTITTSTNNSVTKAKQHREINKSVVLKQTAELPLRFEQNLGQVPTEVKYLLRAQGYHLHFTPQGATWYLPNTTAPDVDKNVAPQFSVLQLRLTGGQSQPSISASEQLPGVSNYLRGEDQSKWLTNIPSFGKLSYSEVYPNIDMAYYSNKGQLEYDFIVKPGNTPDAIKIKFVGADNITINDDGSLSLFTEGKELKFSKPISYQVINGDKVFVAGEYNLSDDLHVGFNIAAYDSSQDLIIDPVLQYSTLLGGTDEDIATAVAVDAAGHAFVTGYTTSIDFPTQSPVMGVITGGSDVFVTKMNAAGTALAYSTYLGGTDALFLERGTAIAVDNTGSAYITGATEAADFPTTAGAYDEVLSGIIDVFVTKLNPSGNAIVYSTFIGGTDDSVTVTPTFTLPFEFSSSIALDNANNAYVVGYTVATDFPAVSALQASNSGGVDGFLTKIDATGSTIIYSTYIGGSNDERVLDVAVDNTNNVYITGETGSPDLPVLSAFQPSHGGSGDAFVTKLNSSGNAIVYSTFLGASGSEVASGIVVDSANNAYVIGETSSAADFPLLNPVQMAYGGGTRDAFVTKLNSSGNDIIYSTFLGGSGNDFGIDIAVDNDGAVYAAGHGSSSDFPVVSALQAFGGVGDAFVTKINSAGSALVYSTTLGGSGNELTGGIAITGGDAYVVGATLSADFMVTTGAYKTVLTGSGDAFIVKIADDAIGFDDLISKVKESDASKYLKLKLKLKLLVARCALGEGCIFDKSQQWVDEYPDKAHALGCAALDKFIAVVNSYVNEPDQSEWIDDAESLKQTHNCN